MIQNKRIRAGTLARLGIIFCIVVVSICLCVAVAPCLVGYSEEDPSQGSAAALDYIGRALLEYYKTYGTLPPANVLSKEGKPLYSWRVLILRLGFLSDHPFYDGFRLDEPWDSPHNKPFSEKTPRCFLPGFFGTNDPPGLTRYQVLVGPGTPFERPGLGLHDFTHGVRNTILVVEGKQPVPWSKPADLIYEPNRPLPELRCEYSKPVFFLCHRIGDRAGFNAVFADGTTKYIHSDSDETMLRALMTGNASEKVQALDR
jgi:hypothetical protein